MHEIALINMPFASLRFPSLALTQVHAVVDRELAGRARAEVLYLNHDFARYLGVDFYQRIAVDMEAPYNGLGDWFFRQAAFPDLEDNTALYFQRYFPHRSEDNEKLKARILDKRPGLVEILDQLIDRYALDRRDLIGFTSMFSQNVASFAMARRIKERNPGAVVVMGGANCESPMGREIVNLVEPVDFVFSGTGLRSFPDFVRCLLDGDEDGLQRINGVLSKTNEATQTLRSSVGDEMPLDSLPVEIDYDPFLDLLTKNFPGSQVEPILPFETSRGCWWGERAHCTFCGLNGVTMAYRSMDAVRAGQLIRSLFKYSDRASRLQCVDNIMPKHYPQQVFSGLETPERMTIFYEVKVDLTDQDMRWLSEARVKEVQPGIEALATSTLKLMRKGTTAFQNVRFLMDCVRYDIFPDWSLLVGFPGEKEEVYEKYLEDIPTLVHLPPPSGVYPIRPDRFSPYHTNADDYGLDLQPSDFYELVYPFDKASLANLAYFFRDHNFSAEYFTAMVRRIDELREMVELWRSRWSTEDHELPPMLYRMDRDGTTVVYDSRAGTPVVHEVSPAGLDVLQSLGRPRRRRDLVADLGRAAGVDPEAELAALRAMGLIFEERGQAFSLVLSEKPSASERLAGWSWAA